MGNTIFEVNNMNKVGKAVMYTMGAGAIFGAAYYAGLPKSKKNALKDKAKKMIKQDANFMDELS